MKSFLLKYPKRTTQENKVIKKQPYKDSDKDGVMNWFDCKPLNKKKQSMAHLHPALKQEHYSSDRPPPCSHC